MPQSAHQRQSICHAAGRGREDSQRVCRSLCGLPLCLMLHNNRQCHKAGKLSNDHFHDRRTLSASPCHELRYSFSVTVLVPFRFPRPPPAPSVKRHDVGDVMPVYLAMAGYFSRLSRSDVPSAVATASFPFIHLRHRPPLKRIMAFNQFGISALRTSTQIVTVSTIAITAMMTYKMQPMFSVFITPPPIRSAPFPVYRAPGGTSCRRNRSAATGQERSSGA